MRMDWKGVGPVCRRVADDLRAEQGPGLFDGLRSIGVDETSYRKGHTYMTVVVDHDRGRVIWMHQGHGQKVFDLFFQALTPARRESIRAGAGDGGRGGSTSACSAGAPWPSASSTVSASSPGPPTRSTRTMRLVSWYNSKRLHASLGYRTPEQAENEHYRTQAAQAVS